MLQVFERRPPRGIRLILSVGIGLLAAARAVRLERGGVDFWQLWYAARVLIDGRNPYAEICPGCAFDWSHLFYPGTAVVAAIPLGILPRTLATALFVAFGTGALTWVLGARNYGVLLGLLSASVVHATELGQSTPLLAASASLPWLAVLYAAKPSTAAAMFVAWPRWHAVWGGLALLAISLLLMPAWPADWRASLATIAHAPEQTGVPYLAPITRPGGALLLLALLRWRRPEARLLLALGCVPQAGMLYEAVLLLLIPRSAVEALVLAAGSWIYTALVMWPQVDRSPMDWQLASSIAILLCCYLPALVMVLRRENEGIAPAWLDRLLAGAPRLLRGQPLSEDR